MFYRTCNVTVCKYIYDTFKSGTQVDVIYTDFANTFDSINHGTLVSILAALELSFLLLSWFGSNLLNRPQWVKLFCSKSHVFTATSGVSQGGYLLIPYSFCIVHKRRLKSLSLL